MTLVLLPRAEQDVRDIAAYLDLESRNPSVGRRFLSSLRETCHSLTQHPFLGQKETVPSHLPYAHLDVRRFAVHQFRSYLIFYRVQESSVIVIRVLHGARNPELRTVDIP